MRQGETLHATESLWRATGRRTPARHLPSPVSWQTCGLRVGGAAHEANLQSSLFLQPLSMKIIQFSLNIRQNLANCPMWTRQQLRQFTDYGAKSVTRVLTPLVNERGRRPGSLYP